MTTPSDLGCNAWPASPSPRMPQGFGEFGDRFMFQLRTEYADGRVEGPGWVRWPKKWRIACPCGWRTTYDPEQPATACRIKALLRGHMLRGGPS